MQSAVVESLANRIRSLSPKTRQAIRVVLFAAAASLAAVAFHYAIHFLYHYGLEQYSQLPFETFLWRSFATCVGGSLIAGWLLSQVCREAAGSGIPQLKAAYWKNFGAMSFRQLWVKFVAAAIQIGGGSSLGREGPSVQIAGAAGSLVSGALGDPKQRRRAGAITGAAAGLAAAFNTPLAAVTFVLEEILGDLNSRLMGRVLLAALIGAMVTHALIGPQPAFLLSPIGSPSGMAYILSPVVALIGSLIGVLFQKGALGLRGRARHWRVPMALRPAIGAMITWAIAVAVFRQTGHLGVFGLGYEDLSAGLAGELGWQIALTLLGAKLVATIASYGTGGAGGIFSPTLFFGAMTGLAFAGLLQPVLNLTPDDVILLAVVGMTSTLGAVVRAPVTSILIVFEMTRQFAMVPPLMLGMLVSGKVAKLLQHNFYDALLEQDGHDLDRLSPPLDIRRWQSQPATAMENPPVVCDSLDLEDLRHLRRTTPFDRYPVVIEGKLEGILTRPELRAALAESREPKLERAVTCSSHTSLRDIQMQLVDSPTGMVLVMRPDGTLSGLFTLHDLLRAQHQLAGEPD